MSSLLPTHLSIGGILERDSRGLYCPAGRFWIDPHRKVQRAVVTHAHSDHARPGSLHYLTTVEGEQVLRLRVGEKPVIQGLRYGEAITIGDAKVSLHPAGHVLGSAQVRIEVGGKVVVVSGDYKVEADPTCAAFEPVRCHAFVTESTFALPIYRWPTAKSAFADIHHWWRDNQQHGRCSVISCYALGKAQRLLSELSNDFGPIAADSAVMAFVDAYRQAGVKFPNVIQLEGYSHSSDARPPLILASSNRYEAMANGFPGGLAFGSASGWMALNRFRRADRSHCGFVLSDHADWDGLLSAIRATEAREIWVTHGYTKVFARWLQGQGYHAHALELEESQMPAALALTETTDQLRIEWDED